MRALILALLLAAPALAAPPARVVSMNLCTDQLAMLLARSPSSPRSATTAPSLRRSSPTLPTRSMP